MGVDYRANFGFGIQVTQRSSEEESETYFSEDLEELLEGSKYEYFEVGKGSYTGKENDFYVVVNHRLLNQDNLKQESEGLLNFLDAKGIDYVGTPNIVGGLHVY